ncbi:MAG: Rrf2 family transcriptional regulator [Phycisphaerae bacterium]|nr:Rrf2 family transcriptional regulator [Phycisphaerae bacterium]
MKVSTRTRYGIRAAIELAQHHKQGPLQLRIIAERQAISVKYLEQLVAVLRSGGIVRSLRGARGGYLLAKAPNQVRLSDVFHCLEGPVATTECVEDPEFCDRSLDCVARKLWTRVEGAVNDVLDSVTLQDLLDQAGKQSQNYSI